MTALESARRDAVARLCLAQASGFLSVEAFGERYALVAEATSVATIEGIVADLELEDATPLLPVPTRTLAVEATVDTDGYPIRMALPVEAATSVRIPAVLGSAVRAGTWTVPEHIEVMATLGEVKLDFRDATFSTDTIVIDASVLLGSLTLIVPPGTQIENECEEFMSNSSHPRRGKKRAPPNGILVILQGKVRLGEISIKERPPTGEEPERLKGFFTKLLRRGY
jgi:hypothetical protein